MDAVRILDEPSFRHTLLLERKRSERTAAPFLLSLLDFDPLINGHEKVSIDKVGVTLAHTFRDTDVIGWRKHPSMIGIIFTALNGTSRVGLTEVISARIENALARVLEPDQIKQIHLSFHFFPEQGATSTTDGTVERLMYPGVEQLPLTNRLFAGVKRGMDIAGSLAALALLSPVFLIIAAGIKLNSRGPVFFRQKRLGKYGREFTFLKFRSMHVASDHHIHKQYTENLIRGKAAKSGVYKMQNDPRITSFGRFLRMTSLDELPQFINVLLGQMSLVGPRPPIPYEFECYDLWHRRRVLEAKPGITGLWQVNGRSRTTFDEMVRMDLQYVRTQSVWLDLKILIKTPIAVVSGDGAF